MAANSEAAEAAAAPVPAPAGPVSFGFSRKAERRRLLPAGPGGEPGGDEDGGGDTDFLTAVEDRELLSTRPAPPPPQELVIPLLPSHRWRNPEPPRGPAPSPDHTSDGSPAPTASPAPSGTPSEGPVSVEAQAVQELLREARQSQEGEGDNGPPISIPLSLRDGPPRPQPGPQDYAAVPVAAFGLAMLRGMGWSQGEGIGRTFKQVVKPLEHRLRPRGLGLGAEPAPPKPGQGPPKPVQTPGGGEEGGGEGQLTVGATVRIQNGPHQGMDGKVEGLELETARAVVRLALGGQVVTVSQHCLSLAPPRSVSSSKNPKGKDPEDSPAPGGTKRKPPPPSTQREAKKLLGSPPHPPWLRRDLRVRCVDRSFRGGTFYNCKLVVEDMETPETCVCRTDEGRLVEGLRESMLETVIPRGPGDRVMVVLGEHAGKVGRILEREPGRSRALVQLERDEAGRVVPLEYDAICHYLGGHEDD